MYFKAIDKLLSSVVDITKQSQSIMFTKYPDGDILASVMLGGKVASNEVELEFIMEGYKEERKKTMKINKQYRLKQLQDEIEKIKLENDFNDDI